MTTTATNDEHVDQLIADLDRALGRVPQDDPDDIRYWITARGAIALGGTIDPGVGPGHGQLVAFSEELGTWVRIR